MSKRSKKRDLRATKERHEPGSWFRLSMDMLRSAAYCNLSKHARMLLFDLLAQYNGYASNNGDFSAAWKLMKPRGWKSKETLGDALKELLEAEFILRTRPGGRNHCALYAVTFMAIDKCDGKHDVS